jgi:DDE superfamily endonuclease
MDWEKCIFTDESTFYLNESKGASWCYENQKKIEQKVTYPKKLNVWGCFSANGFGKLYFFEEILDSNLMIKIYKEELIPSINMLFGNNSYECIVVEDNDPKHKSKISREFKDQNSINIMPWPANSPDLNPIENVWGLLKLKIRSKQPKSLMSLKRIIKEEWNAFENTYCENLISSMKNRIISCIASEGDYICY